MGLVTSFFWANTGRTDDPDPITRLTSRDKYMVKHSWDALMKDPTRIGVNLFMKLFEYHPEYQQLFPFRNIPYHDLPSNKRFQAHCNNVVYTLSAVIDNLNDPEIMGALLTKLGANHKAHDVKDESFWEFKKVIMDVFKMEMGQAELQAWEKTIDCTFKLIIQDANYS